jgi:3-deoxy-D-manno-octulosonic-acid transferase
VLIAAQTHPGEDETVLPAHDILRQRFSSLLTIIVPRHAERGPDIAMLCGPRKPARRAAGEQIGAETEIYIADTMGEMGLFYRLAPFCFIGGTLVPLGGHNPLEPAVLRCAILAGPHRANATRAYAAILSAQGSIGSVANSGDIARQAARLLGDPVLAARTGEAAAQGAATQAGAVARTIAVLEGLTTHARA